MNVGSSANECWEFGKKVVVLQRLFYLWLKGEISGILIRVKIGFRPGASESIYTCPGWASHAAQLELLWY